MPGISTSSFLVVTLTVHSLECFPSKWSAVENMAKTKDGFQAEMMGTFSSFPGDRWFFYRTMVFILELMGLFLTCGLWMMRTDYTRRRVRQIHNSPSNPIGGFKKEKGFPLLKPSISVLILGFSLLLLPCVLLFWTNNHLELSFVIQASWFPTRFPGWFLHTSRQD